VAGNPVVFGSYELLDRIAEGGMAEVWRARSRGVAGFEKVVVIKRVLPALMAKPGFADLLIREAKIAARLSHPRIVQIFDLGEENGSYFIAMEYVHGRDLGQAMAYRGGAHAEGLSAALRVWIIAEAAGALDHAHRRKGDEGRPLQIVHRDISPQNILLGYEGEVKVADFGIARADEQGLGRGEDPKILRGKYAYMAPEQARGEPLDRRADLFSLGIVLYELLSGRRMFRGRSSHETLALVRQASVPPLDAHDLGIDESLARVLRRCLAAAREDRYGWASEVYSDLTHWLFQRGEPVGQPYLAEAMARMFPPEDAVSPNKLRVDVLMRAYQDATAISAAGAMLQAAGALASTADGKTSAAPKSRKVSIEQKRIAYLAAEARPGEDAAFEAACDAASGRVLPSIGREGAASIRIAAFGHAAGAERGAAHAARAALELRRLLRLEPQRVPPVPAIAVLDGEGRIAAGAPLEPEDDVALRAAALIESASAGEIAIAPTLEDELARGFRIERGEARGAGATPLVLDGFRARSERDATMLRKRAPFVGRRDELHSLAEAVVAVDEGGHAVVHVVGEPGAGKSRLIAELRGAIATRDVLVVTSRADEADVERPLAALADLVRDLAGIEAEDTPSERFAKIERLRVLALTAREVRTLGELIGLSYPVAREERDGRPRGIEVVIAIRKALAQLAHDRTVVLVLEDVHWLDDWTRQLLPLLLKGLERPRVLVIVTRRSGAIAPHLPGRVIRLGPLPLDATGRLFAASLRAPDARARAAEPDLAAMVLAETAGNPAWIEMLAAESRSVISIESGTARAIAPLPADVPSAARNLISARLAPLRRIDRALLAAAASFEGAVATELLFAVVGVIASAGAAPLRRLLARRLLVALDSLEGKHAALDESARPSPSATHSPTSTTGGAVPIRRSAPKRLPPRESAPFDPDVRDPVGSWGGDDHTSDPPTRVALPGRMLKRAVLATLDPGERERLHATIVATLERLPSSRTAEGMRRLAHHAARSPDRRRATDYLVQSAQLAESAHEPRAAATDLALAGRILREDGDDPDRSVELALRAARLALVAGATDMATQILDEIAAVFGSHARSTMRVAIASARAEAALVADRPEQAIEALGGDVEPLLEASEHPVRGIALLSLGRALIDVGRIDAALAALGSAVDAFARAGDLAGRGRALAVLALAEARADRVRESDDTAEEALAIAARFGHGELRYAALAAIGASREAAGDRTGAAARLREAAEVAAHVGLELERPIAGLRAALACFRIGQTTEAATRIEQALVLGRRRKLERIQVLGAALQATIAMVDHPDASYVPTIERAIARLVAMQRPAEAALAAELLAHAQRTLGDVAAAGAALLHGVELARRAGWSSLARDLDAQSRE
jgi:tetratricopeptide (TPR) repeat protein